MKPRTSSSWTWPLVASVAALSLCAVFTAAAGCSDDSDSKPAGSSGTSGSSGASGASGSGGAINYEPVRFIAVGDTGEGNQGQYDVSAAIEKVCKQKSCDFGLLLGDNFYETGVESVDDPQFIDKFEKVYENLTFPFYVVLGNHDYGGKGAGYEKDRAQAEVDYTQKSKKWVLPDKYYHFNSGPAEFFVLDTTAQMFSDDDKQKTDVKKWLSESTFPWKIALGHHPYLSNGPHGNAGEYDGVPQLPIFNGATVKEFHDDIVCGKADVYLCGHDHSRQWMTDTCKNTELIVSGAGCKTTELPGKNDTRFQSLDLGFLWVEITNDQFTAQFYDSTGKMNYERVLKH